MRYGCSACDTHRTVYGLGAKVQQPQNADTQIIPHKLGAYDYLV